VSRALQTSIERWKTLADGVGKEAGEVQRALTQVRTRHSNLCAEQEKIRFMKQGYLEQLKEAEHSQDDLQQSTQLRRFMGQLDLTTRAITDQMADLQRQQQTIAARFRELNSERIKFETLADRARTQLKQTTQKKEQKDSDALNAQRFAIKLNQRPSS
jgi:flagellar biosynthesis chaperone FliJ